MFACLHYEEGFHPYGWFGWCAENSLASNGLESWVWWCLRYEDEDPDTDWIGYVASKQEWC